MAESQTIAARESLLALQSYLEVPMKGVMSLVEESLRSDIALLDHTNRSLLAQGGKRIRPMMALLSCGAAGGICPDGIRFAAAAELLHNATLLHDDVVDGSGERRGFPTVRTILNGPASVLIGDYWLVKAMDVILGSSRCSEYAISMFSKTLSDLAEGELLQLQKACCCDTDYDDYLKIVYCKTASLFVSSCRTAARAAGATEEVETALGEYARAVGIAFQIRDDILDYEGGEALGKPCCQDIREQKITLPFLCAMGNLPASEQSEWRSRAARVHEDPSLVEEIHSFVLSNGGIEGAQKVLEEYTEKAVSALSALGDSEEKSYLAGLARYLGARDY